MVPLIADGHLEPLEPDVGWGVLHLFCKVTADLDTQAVAVAVKTAEADSVQVVTVAILGHRAEIGFVALASDLWKLHSLKTSLRLAGLDAVDSYVSLTEVSEYAAGLPEAMLESRLHPRLPPEGMRAFCFYPMSKRREETANWYGLGFEDRLALMKAHGAVGRRFAGRILQLITGSTGLDDFEWGVTLFGVHPDDLKDCVYEMRFDEASARYAEFGNFHTGIVGDLKEILGQVAGE